MKSRMIGIVAALCVASTAEAATFKKHDCFSAWPEGKDPETVARRLIDQFASTSPDNYKPQGYSSEERFTKNGYGGGKIIHYSVVSL